MMGEKTAMGDESIEFVGFVGFVEFVGFVGFVELKTQPRAEKRQVG